ncbi:MAG: hypothetical protein RI952_1453, partial [Bacteroidota bacterium]
MKKQLLKKLFLVMCMLSPFFAAAQTPLIVENFNYTVADTLRSISGAGWTPIATVSNINKIPVVSPGLSYTGSTASGIGNAVAIKTTGEDIGKPLLLNYRDNAVYASFLINVSAAQATGDYFFAFLDSALSGTNYRARTFIKTSGTGYKIGVSKSGTVTAAGYYATDLNFNTTYQIVVKYSIITGATNDSVKLFVNPVLGASEPTTASADALVTETDITLSSTVGIGGVALRQGTASSAPTLSFDGLKVGRSWSSVTALAVTNPSLKFNPTTLTVNENAGTATVTLNIVDPNATATTVDVKVKGGSATAGSDYTFTTQTVTFPANSTAAQSFTIPIIDDSAQETDETIQLVLRNAGNSAAILADSILTITIPLNDVSTPVLGFAAPLTLIKKEGNTCTFDVNITSANLNATSVNVILKSTSTASTADYSGLTQTVTFPANSSAAQSKTITIVSDNLAENAEEIVFVLRNATNGAILTADSILTITIPQNDQPVQAKFSPATLNVLENASTATVSINVLGASSNANATTFDVVLKGGTATAGSDFTYTNTTVTIPAFKDTTINLTATILNDMLVEGNESIIFAIRNISNSGVIGSDSILTVTLKDDEVPFYSISDLRVNDSMGNPTFPLATPLAIRGVVYSPNLRLTGLQFSLVDATGAMTIFKASGNLGYTVTQGDSLAVYGKLSPYNGLNEVAIDSFKVLANGIALKAPKVVTQLKEEDESNIVKINRVHIIDPAQWTKTGSGFNVKVTNGTDTLDMRILNAVDLYTMDAPIGDFNLTGVVSQFDATNPKNSGYQLMPRGSSDIYVIPAPPVDPTVAIELGSYTTVEGAGTATLRLVLDKPAFDSVYVNFDVAGGTATPGSDYTIATPNPVFFNLGDSVKIVTINIVNDTKVETPETINVEISNPIGATLGNRTTSIITINDNDTLVGINTNAKAGISVYPNPAHGMVNIKTVNQITKIQVINAIGQVVLEKSYINNNFSSIELNTI